MLTVRLGERRGADQPQNPLVEGKRGTSTYTTPMLAASSANLEQELSAKTLLLTPEPPQTCLKPTCSKPLLNPLRDDLGKSREG